MLRPRPAQWVPLVWCFLLYGSGRVDGFLLSAAFAMLVAFPMTLAIDEDVPAWLRNWAAGAGMVASLSLLLVPGVLAASIAATWMLVALPNAAYAFLRFLSAEDRREPMPWAEATAGVGPIVAAVALCWSRFDSTFAGFGEPFATLTVTHFHFTFGLLPLALSALARAGIGAQRPLWGIVFVPPVIGFLFATRANKYLPSSAEALAVVVLALVVFAWSFVSPRHGAKIPWWARSTVRFAGLGLMVGMFVAVIFVVTLVGGAPRFDFRQVLSTHGVFNALSMVALGFVAQSYARIRGISGTSAEPDLAATTRDVDPAKALFVDSREFPLGSAANGRFERLTSALLHYQFYPDTVMISAGTFKAEGREARVGDRIGMCLLVPLFYGMPAARFPATTEVNVVERGPDVAAFGYLTTTSHYGKGAWCARIERRGDQAILLLQSRMTPTHPLALLGLPLYRWFQKRAHRAGAARLGAVA